MSAGLPVIASDFPLWKEIIEINNCGICVSPDEPQQIADAVDNLAANPYKAYQMGQNGKKAVNGKYNWLIEEKKLLAVYQRLT
jgi:glycosyltransferase involved in cell wall biosynthesis